MSKPPIGDPSSTAEEIAAWKNARNARRARIHWTFMLAVARQKLRKLYPSIEDRRITSGGCVLREACARPACPRHMWSDLGPLDDGAVSTIYFLQLLTIPINL